MKKFSRAKDWHPGIISKPVEEIETGNCNSILCSSDVLLEITVFLIGILNSTKSFLVC
ncbi:hypothetical protein J437_LFUL003608 [Ladona fulva]|uniref:Uncharacterized protein n=1 Tax=Ladona fulva TaxID=123851 RepID=A0A8K0P490_LADFU|nr:hypothetical protein J437_LFUL003608 [Ladona fulva]